MICVQRGSGMRRIESKPMYKNFLDASKSKGRVKNQFPITSHWHSVAPMGQSQSQALPIFQYHPSYCFLRDIWCITYKKGDFLPFL
jgi:hypothetical protein